MCTLATKTNKAGWCEVHGQRINHGYARLSGATHAVVHFIALTWVCVGPQLPKLMMGIPTQQWTYMIQDWQPAIGR